ncbi:GNAT family N-acetyltransferase [Tsuneonella sp. YG55]|uniref:GNAT family N-acetyltransferase n=1 Tax=Tsuneonella litorea TaxID=2976475 RepID=A0A9X3AKL6_9SPHN|nr:GNAT family N-acetyltransferase [Tsuneonella litorea]MCT2557988.1 GNAT family N-acetyltransferase [Tsuneonella litorea]
MNVRLPPGYASDCETPSLADYLRLRVVAGLSPFSEEAARAGLPGTVAGVVVRHGLSAVGMGRVIGDGGLFFQVCDIAVDPAHQGRGIGKVIVSLLLEALAARLSAPAYVSLIADGEANRLYAQFGFAPVAPHSQGMAQWLQPAPATSSSSPR